MKSHCLNGWVCALMVVVGGGEKLRGLEAPMVSIVVAGEERVMVSNGIPDHAPGMFPNAGNPNAVAAQMHEFRMPLTPEVASQPTPTGPNWFGVAINGVPFEPGTAEFWQGERNWNYEAKGRTIDLGLDAHNAHVQPTGAYHYHALPVGMKGVEEKRMTLIGWAADGFPIYGALGHEDPMDLGSPLIRVRGSYQLRKGARAGGPGGEHDGSFTQDYEYVAGSGELDECHGRFGRTAEFPGGIYHYHITEEFPYMGRMWKGRPDASFVKMRGGPPRGGPGGGPGGRGEPRGPGMRRGPPPQGGPAGRPPPPGLPGKEQR